MLKREGQKTLATELRKVIYLQTKVLTADGQGGFTETWNESANGIWAAIYPIRAERVAEFRSLNVHATHFVKIRGRIEISESNNRLRFGSRFLEIITVEDLQEQQFVKLMTCREIRS
jgi:SPP1 family predicted phage head-tail adaptor